MCDPSQEGKEVLWNKFVTAAPHPSNNTEITSFVLAVKTGVKHPPPRPLQSSGSGRQSKIKRKAKGAALNGSDQGLGSCERGIPLPLRYGRWTINSVPSALNPTSYTTPLHMCLQRYGISRLPDIVGTSPGGRGVFKALLGV